MERRRSQRFKTRFDTLVSAEAIEGAGVLAEISQCGAYIEDATTRPEIGSRVTLYIFIQPVAPFELVGRVARHTDAGFAIDYDLFDPEIRRLVEVAS